MDLIPNGRRLVSEKAEADTKAMFNSFGQGPKPYLSKEKLAQFLEKVNQLWSEKEVRFSVQLY